MVTSSAVVGSPAISRRGIGGDAMAIITRCDRRPTSGADRISACLRLGQADLAEQFDGAGAARAATVRR